MNTSLNLKQFKKIRLIHQMSPISHLENLSKVLGVDIYIKRDDLSEIGLGGNKLRKLEYLLGDAKQKKATHIITLGALQSNHARLTAVAAIKTGFQCELFLKKSVPVETTSYQENGNLLIERIMGAKIHQIEPDKLAQQHVEDRMNQIKKEGGKPYLIPVGGSNALGTLGYLDCFYEILQQSKTKINFNHICTASGSGGTHAGLVVGKKLSGSYINVNAYNVQPESEELIQHTVQIGNEALSIIHSDKTVEISDIQLSTTYAGGRYGFPEEMHIETIKFLAKHEGIFLDPVYTSKAFTGMIMDIENGIYKKGEKILFIHTGGTPGLFAYEDFFSI